MKIKRYKKAQKYISFFRNNFNLWPPFTVLVDGTFCSAALENKINIREQLPKYLNEAVNIATTECVLSELNLLGTDFAGALHVCSQFRKHKCGHRNRSRTALGTSTSSARECLIDVINSNVKEKVFFVATQDDELANDLGNIPGVPILRIKHNGILIEKPSAVSEAAASGAINARLNFSTEQQTIKDLKLSVFGRKGLKRLNTLSSDLERPKRKAKGPNPLSCKNKKKHKSDVKKSDQTHDSSKHSQRKRKRRKKTSLDVCNEMSAS